jgi:superfamily I DNA/RNA helicase
MIKRRIQHNSHAPVVSRSHLTPHQLEVVEKPFRENRIVVGPAGSGKTQVLIHRAAYLAEACSVPPEKYLLFVFTDIAREYLGSASTHLSLSWDSITTFDNWCRLFYENYISRDLPRTYTNLRIDYAKIRLRISEELKRRKKIPNLLEFALVDDGQDLAPEAFEIFKIMARHITVFADFQQKIVENQTTESTISSTLQTEGARDSLLGTHRNAPQVAKLASCFISEERAKQDYLNRSAARKKIKELPQCFSAPSLEKEMDLLAETLKMRLSKHERVGIIVPTPLLLHNLVKELKKRGVPVEKAIEPDAQNVFHDAFDFENNVPKIATNHTAKGLTFDSVFLPQLTEEGFLKFNSPTRLRMLFMGIARARKWVYLSTVKGRELKEFDTLNKAKDHGYLLML